MEIMKKFIDALNWAKVCAYGIFGKKLIISLKSNWNFKLIHKHTHTRTECVYVCELLLVVTDQMSKSQLDSLIFVASTWRDSVKVFFITFKPQFSEQSIFCQMCALPIAIYFALNAIRILSLREIEKQKFTSTNIWHHTMIMLILGLCAKKHQKANKVWRKLNNIKTDWLQFLR